MSSASLTLVRKAWRSYPIVDLILIFYRDPSKTWTVDAVAKRMGVHNNTARHMLLALQVRGVIEQMSGPQTDDFMGRPPDHYCVKNQAPLCWWVPGQTAASVEVVVAIKSLEQHELLERALRPSP